MAGEAEEEFLGKERRDNETISTRIKVLEKTHRCLKCMGERHNLLHSMI